MPRAFGFLILAAAICTFWLYAAGRPPLVIGDGGEYLCTAAGWVHDLRPWPEDDTISRCAAGIRMKPEVIHGGYLERDGKRDGYHFWFLPLLAAPWWLAAEASGWPAQHSFTWFNWMATLATAALLVWRAGVLRAAAVLALLFSSPLIFFSDKAHAEWFVALALLLASVEMLRGEWLWCAVWTAAAATQQVTLAPFALLATALWYARARRAPRGREWALITAAVALLALSPIYYLVRWGHPNLIRMVPGFTDPGLISLHRALSLYVDPDIGLFPNWPLGLIVVLLAAVAGFFVTRMRLEQAVWTGAVLVLFPLAAGAQTNWNHGGTLYISRYAALLIAVLAPLVVWRLMALRPEWLGPAAIFVLCVAFAGYNFRTYHPAQGQRYLFHSPFATWLYAHHPSWYDPEEHVWMVRSTSMEQLHLLQGPRMWAVGNQECTKLLLRVDPATVKADMEPPLGCVSTLDRQALVKGLREGRIRPSSRGYINLAP